MADGKGNLNSFKLGTAIKLYYFLVLGKTRKIFISLGVIKRYKKRFNSVSLQGFYAKELVEIRFSLNSPYIVLVQELRSYNFSDAQKKFSRRKNYNISTYNNDKRPLFENIYKFDPYDYLYNSVMTIAEKQRLRRKFRL